MNRILTLTAIVSCLSVIGCTAAPASGPAPKRIAAGEYPRMYQASIDVLRDSGFIVDRQDYRFGKVSSKPQISGTIAEPWKPSSSTAAGAIESTTNEQRRVVLISLEPLGSEGGETIDLPAAEPNPQADYQLRVEVIIERLQAPDRYLTGSTTGGRIISHYGALPAELKQRGIPDAYWRPVGRDTLLEQRLMEKIVRRSVDVQVPGEPTPEVFPPASAKPQAKPT